MQKKKLQILTNNIKNAWLVDSYMNMHHNSNKYVQLGINILPLFTRLQDKRFSYAPCKIKLVSAQFAPEVLWNGHHRLHQCLPHHCV